ncbi:MAG: hypothetical protein IT567_06090 [Alphaproteobacteria bacterium]|nr:hypothetical protein [Alphaproteobacteria bacterium]
MNSAEYHHTQWIDDAMTDTTPNAAPGMMEHLAYNVVNAAGGWREKLNKPPGLHLLFCAVGATIFGFSALTGMDYLSGRKQLKKQDIPGQEKSGDLLGILHYDEHKILPTWNELKELSPEERKAHMWNETCASLHRFVPAIAGGIGILLGSKLFFQSRGEKSVYKQLETLSDSNMLEAQRKISYILGDAMGPLSAFLMSTGGGSLRSFAGTAMTSKFIMQNGDLNALPGMADVLHGHHVSWKYNYCSSKIIDAVVVPYLANNPEFKISKDNLKDASAEILRQFYGNEAATEARVNEMVKLMLDIRKAFVKELALDEKDLGEGGNKKFKATLQAKLQDAIHGHFNWFMETATGLDPKEANLLGAGVVPMVGVAMASLFGGMDRIRSAMDEFKKAAPDVAPHIPGLGTSPPI